MKKLLFIEDDTIVGRMYQSTLQLEGFQVDLVEDGERGLAALRRSKPDLVLLDLMLPKVNGVQILRHIRAQSETKSLPVIVLTNAYLSQMVEEAGKAGANLCLTKAVTTPAKLVEATRQVIASGGTSEMSFLSASKRSANGKANKGGARELPDPKKAFWESAPEAVIDLKGLARELIRVDEKASRILLLSSMYEKVHALAGNAALAEAHIVERMATALEALLKELEEHPGKINPSTMRTVAQSTELLSEMLSHSNLSPAMQAAADFTVLVVDDEVLTLQAVNHALSKADLKPQCVEDPLAAYQLMNSKTYDLAIIDVKMPGMDGFELCKKLHTLPTQRHTPVIFLTRLADFENRVRSAQSGGTDFIAKPFLFMELTVKAMMHVLRKQLVTRSAKDSSFRPL